VGREKIKEATTGVVEEEGADLLEVCTRPRAAIENPTNGCKCDYQCMVDGITHMKNRMLK
jgi:hypothetical protein